MAGNIMPDDDVGFSGSTAFDVNDYLLTNINATLQPEFRKSTNEIENKVWFELDVSDADTIVIINGGKKVEIDKKDFLQKVGLEW